MCLFLFNFLSFFFFFYYVSLFYISFPLLLGIERYLFHINILFSYFVNIGMSYPQVLHSSKNNSIFIGLQARINRRKLHVMEVGINSPAEIGDRMTKGNRHDQVTQDSNVGLRE